MQSLQLSLRDIPNVKARDIPNVKARSALLFINRMRGP